MASRVALTALLCALLIGSAVALPSRALRQAPSPAPAPKPAVAKAPVPSGPSPTETSFEQNTLYIAARILRNLQGDTAEQCKAACDREEACKAFAFCPTSATDGCPVSVGDLAPGVEAASKPGICTLSTDASPDSFTVLFSAGPGVRHVSGRKAITQLPGAAGAAGTGSDGGEVVALAAQGTPSGTAVAEDLSRQSGPCAALPPAHAACGQQSLLSYVAAQPADAAAFLRQASAKFGRDWAGTACTPSRVRLACRNVGDPRTHMMAFDVACGAAGTKTVQAWGLDAGQAFTYVGPAC